MVHDFHTHTSLSDGELSPMEMIRRSVVAGYSSIALTDHASVGDLERIVPEIIKVCAAARKNWNILAIPGIELTHLPVKMIGEMAKMAKDLGAWIVVVHGETIVEPVEKGTNLAAIKSPHVDILAHPGLLTLSDAKLAVKRGKFLEISARKGHSLTNGHVAGVAQKAGARLLINSDAHADSDLLSEEFATAILQGAGLNTVDCKAALFGNPEALVKSLLVKHKDQSGLIRG
jgi:putative hydrolase